MIVVVESPCAPQPAAVEKLIAMPSSEGSRISNVRFLNEAGLTDWQLFRQESKNTEEIRKYAHRLIRLRNTYYARAAMLDCLLRGEAPFLSHLLYTQVLDDDDDAEEREHGMVAGIRLSKALMNTGECQQVFYVELGISSGMLAGAKDLNVDALVDFDDSITEVEDAILKVGRKLGDAARAWYLEHVPAAIAWLV